jgi:hypothetical protein
MQHDLTVQGRTAEILADCARVALQGYDVAFVVHKPEAVRYARDLCAAQSRPDAVAKGMLFYGASRVFIVAAREADWRLKGWRGFVVLDHDFDFGCVSYVHPDERRAMRDLRDIVNLKFQKGEFKRLARANAATAFEHTGQLHAAAKRMTGEVV